MTVTITKKEIVQALLQRKILITPNILSLLRQKSNEELFELYQEIQKREKNIAELLINNPKQHMPNNNPTKATSENTHGTTTIVENHETIEVNKKYNDFVSYFNTRYKTIEKMLRNRQELQGITSINRALQKDAKETVSVIGLVKDVQETRNRNLIITVEDPAGEIKVIVNNSKKEMFDEAKTIVFDEVIGVLGMSGQGVIFANKIIWPDIPIYNELKKSPVEEYAVFISDIHVGSKKFMKEDFEKFIDWTCGKVGSESQQSIVKNLKYIFIVGDMIDGAGIYPGQEDDLEIPDIKGQYDECARLLNKVPNHIKIIISPGNHDAMRLAEPQLPLYKDYAEELYKMSNVIMVSNPAVINIGKREGFPGMNVLMYHGYSFDWYITNVDEIRNNGGYDRADLVMKFMLKRRHLAPTHASCGYIPFPENDPLIIRKVPDIFATGHLHKVSVSHYRNVTLIGASCWQGKTSFQEKMGHHPEPARVPLVNLQTREVKILRFGEGQ